MATRPDLGNFAPGLRRAAEVVARPLRRYLHRHWHRIEPGLSALLIVAGSAALSLLLGAWSAGPA
jgi:hypothetical protein